MLTWQADTWRAGPPRGYDAVLRPHGRATGGPRGAQVAHMARTCVVATRPRGSTWVPVWGATLQVGLAYGGPAGIVGPW